MSGYGTPDPNLTTEIRADSLRGGTRGETPRPSAAPAGGGGQ